MPPTTIREAPLLDSFTPLAEYQSHTPESFHHSKPILFYHSSKARLEANSSDKSLLPILQSASESADSETGALRETIDIYVTSEYVLHPCRAT